MNRDDHPPFEYAEIPDFSHEQAIFAQKAEEPAFTPSDTEEEKDNWRKSAFCFLHPEYGDPFFAPSAPLFDPNHIQEPPQVRTAREQKAKKICNNLCDVQEQCLEYGLSLGSAVPGIWGGLNESERNALLRPRSTRRRSA